MRCLEVDHCPCFTTISGTFSFAGKLYPSLADEEISELKTSSGLPTRSRLGVECGANATLADTCVTLLLHGKLLLTDYMVRITAVFQINDRSSASLGAPGTGGNAYYRKVCVELMETAQLKIRRFSKKKYRPRYLA